MQTHTNTQTHTCATEICVRPEVFCFSFGCQQFQLWKPTYARRTATPGAAVTHSEMLPRNCLTTCLQFSPKNWKLNPQNLCQRSDALFEMTPSNLILMHFFSSLGQEMLSWRNAKMARQKFPANVQSWYFSLWKICGKLSLGFKCHILHTLTNFYQRDPSTFDPGNLIHWWQTLNNLNLKFELEILDRKYFCKHILVQFIHPIT